MLRVVGKFIIPEAKVIKRFSAKLCMENLSNKKAIADKLHAIAL